MLNPHSEARAAEDDVYQCTMLIRTQITEKQHADSRFSFAILETIPRVKYTQVVDILDIALLKIKTERILLCEKVKRIEGFCLSFRDWWDVW